MMMMICIVMSLNCCLATKRRGTYWFSSWRDIWRVEFLICLTNWANFCWSLVTWVTYLGSWLVTWSDSRAGRLYLMKNFARIRNNLKVPRTILMLSESFPSYRCGYFFLAQGILGRLPPSLRSSHSSDHAPSLFLWTVTAIQNPNYSISLTECCNITQTS